jgi:hypothetical protein
VLLPWGDLVGAWGKDRAYYIMDRNGMGHFRPTENAIAQFAPDMTKAQNPGQEGGTGHIHCAPVVFADPEIGPVSYVWGENDRLRGYRFDVGTAKFETQTPATLLSENLLPIGMPGACSRSPATGQPPDRECCGRCIRSGERQSLNGRGRASGIPRERSAPGSMEQQPRSAWQR